MTTPKVFLVEVIAHRFVPVVAHSKKAAEEHAKQWGDPRTAFWDDVKVDVLTHGEIRRTSQLPAAARKAEYVMYTNDAEDFLRDADPKEREPHLLTFAEMLKLTRKKES